MTWVTIVILVLVALGGFFGWRKGALRGLVNLIWLIAIIILSFQFKDFLGTIVIRYMPFFSFAGDYVGVYAVNFLFYQAISFLVVFLLLYCILNILINLSGMVEVLDRFAKVFELPSKIVGALFGIFDMLIYVFLIGFVFLSVPTTAKFIMEDKVAMTVVKQTPILSPVFGYSIRVEQTQYKIVKESTKTPEGANEASLAIVRDLISYDVVEADLIQETIDNGKLHLDNVTVASAK